MKLRVEREVLGEAVSWVARALPTRPVVPVLSGILLEASGETLTLSCFDYETSARAQVPADVGEPGAALVPGRLLADITRSLPPDDVDLSAVAEMAVLTCGSAEFALVTLPLEEYPQLAELPPPAGTVDGGMLAAAAAQVVPAASRDDTLPMLTGVNLSFDGEELTLAATDRYRLAVRTLAWMPAGQAEPTSALVPAKTLADVARTMEPGKPVTIGLGRPDASGRGSDGMISFEGRGRRLTARLLGGEFIRYESRFPADFGASAELAAGPFAEAVRRVALVADRASPVQLAFRHGTAVIEARSDGRARGTESVPAHFAGAEQQIAFNPHYLLDGLAAAGLCAQPPGAEGLIRLQFTSPAKPALITWIDGGAPAGHGEHERVAGPIDQAGNGAVQPTASEQLPAAPGNQGPERAAAAAFRYLVVPLRSPLAS